MAFRVQFYDTNNLEEHAKLIAGQVEKSLRDPATRKLALNIATNTHGWVVDPRTGQRMPAVQYHNRSYLISSRTCHQNDDYCVVANVWNFLVLNVRYTQDIDGYDTYQDLRTTLEAGGGDCDDFTIAFGALLRALGYRLCQKIISLDGNYWAHVYPQVETPNGWITLDATEVGRPMGWEFGAIRAARAFPLAVESY